MEEKREEITSKAADMFGEYGIRSVSIDDICREISISKKTFYQYFENKSELLEAILNIHVEQALNKAQKIKEQANNAIEALLMVSKTICRISMNARPAAAFDLKKYYPEIHKEFINYKRKLSYDGIVMNMRRGISEGIYREDLSVELVAQLYVKKIEQMHDKEFMENIEFSPETIFQVMFENHIRAISNQKGIEIFEKEKQNLNFNIDDDTSA